MLNDNTVWCVPLRWMIQVTEDVFESLTEQRRAVRKGETTLRLSVK